MLSFTVRVAGFALAAFALSGCATLTTGSNQSITVVTDPSGAECRLERGGTTVAIVNPTPGTVQVDKSKNTITVTCAAEGFQNSVALLDSEFQGMTVGNVLFGGIVGVAIDAGSGAMNQYPSQITVLLIPESFPTVEKRDTFFEGAIDRAEARTSEAVAIIKSKCADDDGCKREVTVTELAGASEVSQLKSQWAAAKIEE